VWLNQCVGELNYRWFLLFLAYHIFFFGYAAWIVGTLLVSKAVGLQGQIFHNRATQKDMKANAWLITRYLCTKETALVTVALLAVAMCGAIGGFFGYHMYLQWHGMTTNESFKWDRAWKLYDRLLEVHDKARKEIEGFAAGEDMLEGEEEEGEGGQTKIKTKGGAGDEPDYEQEEEPMAGCVGTGAMPRVVTSLTRQVMEGMQEGKPYEDMPLRHPGERPSNIYHRGFLRNLWNVAFPRALLAENVAKRGSGPKIVKIEKTE
jgi:hypothetical protein